MRISATLIDQWLRFKRDTEGYATEDQLIESIKGTFIPTRQVKCGMAFDQILQDPPTYRTGEFYEHEGIQFPAKDMDEECIPLFQAPGLWQPKETKTYEIQGEPVTVVTKVDKLVANFIDEIKTYYSSFDYAKYADAHQWRWYLLNFDAAYVRYSCFGWYDGTRGLSLNDVHRFRLYRYPDMERECLSELSELVSYIHKKGLESYVADDRPYTRKRVA